MEVVTTALGDDVHDGAGRTAELGLVAAALDFNFLDEVLEQGGALDAVGRVVHLHAVDDVVALGRARAVERGAVSIGVRSGDGGEHLVEGARVAAVRNQRHLLLGDGAAAVSVLGRADHRLLQR